MHFFVQHKEMHLLGACLVLTAVFTSAFCSSEEVTSPAGNVKALIIREIMKKVSNLTLDSLSNVPDDKKEKVLKKIENKLKLSASGLADGQKYIKFIMDEFKRKAFAKKPHYKKQFDTNEKSAHHSSLRSNKEVVNSNMSDTRTKEEVISDIANKIESMAKIYLKETQTLAEKKSILHKIERRILESSKRKHLQIHKEHNALKAYTNLITQGLEVTMKKLLKVSARRMSAIGRRNDMKSDLSEDDKLLNDIDQIDQYKKFFSELWKETSIDPHCEDNVDDICVRIKALSTLPCGDGKVISLEQLCDGVSDCWTLADETNCQKQAAGKLQQAIEIMTDVDESISKKCLKPIVEPDFGTLSNHHFILRGMLDSQMQLIENYESVRAKAPFKAHGDNDAFLMKKIIGDIGKLVTTLSYSMEGVLCLPQEEKTKFSNISRRGIHLKGDENMDYASELYDHGWLPRSCTCKGHVCKLDNCDPRCKRVCWQKYSLNHWTCQSLSGDSSISLDLVCDGKIDCYDESDETSCKKGSSISKSDVNEEYDNLIQLLSLKSMSVDYENSRSKIAAQISLVRQLQKLTTKLEVDIHAVKILRNQFFTKLVNMYKDMLEKSNLEALDHSYDYLLLLNKKMLDALKLSHTGNEIVISPSGCYCKNGTCALLRCSPKCVTTCSVEPVLTKYSCADHETFIQIKSVCNGKLDCPGGDDERNCSKEACRGHHLVMLRHSLQNVGSSLNGTNLGEVINDWKTKVTASLIIAERKERPNHKILENTIGGVLRDLVTAYSSLTGARKNNPDHALKEFKNISDIVMKTLKHCRN
ncbi:uncharacterized protein LOC142976751 [Anticarsia gemmatalis]|uniref:uncharacterized protein LOC142976751 n=1 Tax=Anticarsia gemmatalis TaxID=129554 RepID=UPI003F75E4D7